MREGEIVPVRNDLFVTAQTRLDQCPTSLDLATPRGRQLAFAAGNPGDYAFDREGAVIINAVHWLIMPDEGTDPETGEVSQFARLVLFDREGKFFRTSSAFAVRRMQAALSLWDPSDWTGGIRFIIRQRTGQRGRTYHDIRVCGPEE